MPRRATPSTDTDSIGQRLARFRKERGITQVELAERLGLTQSLISQYENDQLRLNSQLIVDVSRILDISADELLGLTEKRETPSADDRRLLKRLRAMNRLPRRDQQALLRTIDAFLAKAS